MLSTEITGVARTAFGKFRGEDSLSLQLMAAADAMERANLQAGDISAVLTGYSTVSPHLMPANVLAEALGARPEIAFGLNLGGASGLAMVVQACRLVESGAARHVLVVAGENRATGRSRQEATSTLAQVAHPQYELPLGVTVPTLYALLASEYFHRYGLDEDSLVGTAVQMRLNASRTEGAQYRDVLTAADVAASPIIATPLRLLECSPVSDGAAAVVVSRAGESEGMPPVRVSGKGTANLAQHISSLRFLETGARASASRAFSEAHVSLKDVDLLGVYDSFSVTLAMLLEEIGFVGPGETGPVADSGGFGPEGDHPLNLHGGLLSYGHSGVAGGLAHLVEVVTRLASPDQLANGRVPNVAYVHGDGGVMSAHASVVLERTI